MKYTHSNSPIRFSFISIVYFLMLTAMAHGSTTPCQQDNMLVAENYVLDLKEKADAILGTNQAPLEPLKEYLSETIEFDALAKFALGRYWNKATSDQRAEFQYLFRQTTAHALASQVLLLRGATFEILKTSPAGHKDILVRSRVLSQTDEASVFSWRISFKGCQPSVTDLLKEGISMLTTKRHEFASIASRHGVERLNLMLEALARKQVLQPNAPVSVNYDMDALFRQMLLEAVKNYDTP